jgi:hypothetical protein
VARERTADDLVLALLARTAMPMERAEIEQALGWSKPMAAKVLLRLVQLHKVDMKAGEASGTSGRPSAKFSLKDAAAVLPDLALGIPLERRYEPDDVVVTPSDRDARVVLHRRDGWVELEYLDGPRSQSRSCLHAPTLKPYQAGRARPTPYRKT